MIEVASADVDVQNLIGAGYRITGVKPIIASIEETNGDVSVKANRATVTLLEDDRGEASSLVDLAERKAIWIAITTRTLIHKN